MDDGEFYAREDEFFEWLEANGAGTSGMESPDADDVVLIP